MTINTFLTSELFISFFFFCFISFTDVWYSHDMIYKAINLVSFQHVERGQCLVELTRHYNIGTPIIQVHKISQYLLMGGLINLRHDDMIGGGGGGASKSRF